MEWRRRQKQRPDYSRGVSWFRLVVYLIINALLFVQIFVLYLCTGRLDVKNDLKMVASSDIVDSETLATKRGSPIHPAYQQQQQQQQQQQKGEPPKPPPKPFSQYLVHLHVGKAGGSSLNALARAIAKKTEQKFIGNTHFDWSRISELKSKSNRTCNVVMFLRNPIARSVSHFVFAKTLPWTKEFPTFLNESLGEFLHDPETMIMMRDVWQDGMASVAWLTGTHYAGWVTKGLSEEQVRERELKQMNYRAMMHLAADRLEETKWFGILEDTPRSLELLQHAFSLEEPVALKHANQAKGNKEPPSEWAMEALKSLTPQDYWLYDYGLRLFEARWNAYKSGYALAPPERPSLPEMSCTSTRLHVECVSGPLAGLNFTARS
jgi:hypothetical protein